MMLSSDKHLIVVGDRVLIKPESEKDITDHGIYLPAGVQEKEKVQAGYVVKVGPGYPMADPNSTDIEPWENTQEHTKYIPLQAREGDYAVFLRKAAIEIEFESTKYLIVPQAALLVLVRDEE